MGLCIGTSICCGDTYVGTGGGNPPLPPIPVVISSIITLDQRNSILVTWDRAMTATCDIMDQLPITINGGAAIYPDDVVFNGSQMGIVMADDFHVGDVVTWGYVAGVCILREIEGVQNEASHQIYDVDNQLIVVYEGWWDDHVNPWINSAGEDWIAIV